MKSAEEVATSVEKLLDVAIYAPLGMLLQRKTVIGDLAKAGRKQIAFSQSLGRAALKRVTSRTEADEPAAAKTNTKSAAATSKEISSTAAAAKSTAARGRAKPATAKTNTKSAPADLVDGYREMTAREIIAFVPNATPAQIAWMRDAENDAKQRVTVLRALG